MIRKSYKSIIGYWEISQWNSAGHIPVTMSAGELVPMMIMFWVRKDRDDDAQGGLQLGEDVGDVGLVE